MYIYVRYIYIYMYIHICIHTHTHIYTQGNIIQPYKRKIFFAICHSMGESRGHCTKLNRPNTERQKLHDVTYM